MVVFIVRKLSPQKIVCHNYYCRGSDEEEWLLNETKEMSTTQKHEDGLLLDDVDDDLEG